MFSPIPTRGNALAVVVDGDDLSEEQMRQFASWTNLAETTFLLPPSEP
ncbi:PhzF family phenazine biosynthesis protein, partial [Acidihalobacter prosperus]